MGWIRLEDGFPEHSKVIDAGPVAAWLFVRALGHCNRNLTDGFVSSAAVALMNGKRSAVTLVRVGLWDIVRGGFQIHDYLDYQPSREDVLARRSQRAKAGHLGGLAKAKQHAKQNADESPSKSLLLRQAESKQTPAPDPYPVPVPSSVRTGTPRGGRREGLHHVDFDRAGGDVKLDLVAMARAAGDR